jgi:hypothetical protein
MSSLRHLSRTLGFPSAVALAVIALHTYFSREYDLGPVVQWGLVAVVVAIMATLANDPEGANARGRRARRSRARG